jgi:hypothetical protein
MQKKVSATQKDIKLLCFDPQKRIEKNGFYEFHQNKFQSNSLYFAIQISRNAQGWKLPLSTRKRRKSIIENECCSAEKKN